MASTIEIKKQKAINRENVELAVKTCSPSSKMTVHIDSASERTDLEELDATNNTFSENAKKRKYKKMFIIRIFIRLIAIAIMITLIKKLKINVNDYLELLSQEMHLLFGNIWSPILFCLIFSLWSSLSPTGYLSTVLCGLVFKWYIAVPVAYISINIGSIINILLIRYVILKYKNKNCCIDRTLKLCFGKKMGQVSFLKKLFIATSPIKVIILLRLPYLNNGLLNYLFSLQVDSISIKQNIIGNLIGFIPGSILFSMFGSEIKSLVKIIANGGFDNRTQMILFIVVCTLTVVCYICIALKVKTLIKKAGQTNGRVIINVNNNEN